MYDNGDKLDIAQVALAQFAERGGPRQRRRQPDVGELDVGSGACVDAAGTGARGTIDAGALEASNVDLGSELVTLIAYQQAYSADSKTVTTANQMMQTAMQMTQ